MQGAFSRPQAQFTSGHGRRRRRLRCDRGAEAGQADQDGVSFWRPGNYGRLAAVPQQPGSAVAIVSYYTSVGSKRCRARGHPSRSSRLEALIVVADLD